MSKLILLLLIPAFSFAQPEVISRNIAAGGLAGPTVRGGYVQHVWNYENGFGSVGLEVAVPKQQPVFIATTANLGYYLGAPFLAGGFGAGLNAKGKYGAFSEAGAGVRVKMMQASVFYRAFVLKMLDKWGEKVDVEGWYVKVGVEF